MQIRSTLEVLLELTFATQVRLRLAKISGFYVMVINVKLISSSQKLKPSSKDCIQITCSNTEVLRNKVMKKANFPQ